MLFYDIVIIGGGLVGASLASALRDTPYRVALVDAQKPREEDTRLFALSAGSCHLLDHVGVWRQIVHRAAPIHEIHVTSKGQFGTARLSRDQAALQALGYVVPAKYIEQALNEQCVTMANQTVYRPARLTELKQHEAHVELVLATETGTVNLQAELVIGADGVDSTVRTLAGIGVTCHEYHQSAIVTQTELHRPHQQIAHERFTRQGTIAMLPLQRDDHSLAAATIWSGEDHFIQPLMGLSDDAFLQTLQQTFGYRLGRLRGVAHRHLFPLRLCQAETQVNNRVFLLGNAAHTLHPIAAQGFNLALYEVAALVDKLQAVKQSQRAWTVLDLEAVQQQINKQRKTSVSVSHQLATHLAGSGLIQKLLPFGLLGLELAVPVKRQLLNSIMGRTGRVPRLLMSAQI